jgi:hypothetical protein
MPAPAVVDFFQEWASAKNLFAGLPVYASQRDNCERYLGFRPPDEDRFFPEVNAHPPPAVLLSLPFGLLDYRVALLVWNLLSLGGLVFALFLVVAVRHQPWSPWMLMPVSVCVLLGFPFLEQVRQGQWSLPLLVALTALWACERRQVSPVVSGALLALVTAVKLFPGLFFLYFALRRQWKVVGMGAAWLALVGALTVAVLGWSTCWSYGVDVLPQVNEWRSAWHNASLAGLWSKLFDPGQRGFPLVPLVHSPLLARSLTVASWVTVLGLLAWRLPRARTPDEGDHAFGLTILAMILLTPVVWEHSFVLVVLPLFLFVDTASPWRWAWYAAVLPLGVNPALFYRLFMGVDWAHPVWTVATPWHTLTALSVQTYALVALFLLGLRVAAHAPRVTPGNHCGPQN